MRNYSILPFVFMGLVGGALVLEFQASPSRDANRSAEPAPMAITLPQAAPVFSAEVAPARAARFMLQGSVVAQKHLDIKSIASGFVRKVTVDVGDSVKQGQLLVELDSDSAQRQIRRAEASAAAAKSHVEQAQKTLSIAQLNIWGQSTRAAAGMKSADCKASRMRIRADRIKDVMAKCAISQEECDDAEAAAVDAAMNLEISKVQVNEAKALELELDLRRQDLACAQAQLVVEEVGLQEAQQGLEDTKILAPIDGVVTDCFVQEGQLVPSVVVDTKVTLLKLADISRMYVHARAGAKHLFEIKADQSVEIRSEACGDVTFRGRVVRIAPCGTTSEKDVTFCVKIEVLGENQARLKPEMPVSIEIAMAAR